VYHFQYLAVPIELAVLKFVFRSMMVGIAEVIVWLAYVILSKSVSFVM